MRVRTRVAIFRTSAIALGTLSVVTCTAEPPSIGTAEQAAIAQLPDNLNLLLNASTTLTIGSFTQVNGDVGSSGVSGSATFEVSSFQSFSGRLLANTVRVKIGASVGHIFGNDIIVEGSRASLNLGLDPSMMPAVPGTTPVTPGTTNLSVAANQAKQACPGNYAAISLGPNATLNLNGGIYQVSRLTLADGARLEPSEPVVILVSGNMTTGNDAIVRPSAQAINPMTANDLRIEVGRAITLGERNQVRAHLLAPNGKLATGRDTNLTGAAWAKIINIGPENVIASQDVFSAQAQAVPPPCNDNNACTADTCETSGTIAFCRNAAVPSGTSCEDDNTCNGVELCDAGGQCQSGTPVLAGTSCSDEDACNGDETCNGLGTCRSGTPPVVNDGNNCTTDSCDPGTGVSNVPLPDGTECSGVGVCEAGVCSVEGTVFSEDFVQFQSAPAQCGRWNEFLDQLHDGNYSSVTITGTFDLLGVTCNDPAAATQLCRAMRNRGFASVFCNGRSWTVGGCGGTTEISAHSGTCFCRDPGYTVRPCLFSDWGGVNTDTCFGSPSQNMMVVCE